MAVGDIISASRFNNVQNRIAVVMGQGAGSTGYGQTLVSSQKPIGSVVTVADATALRSDMIKARQHQTGVDESGVKYSFLPSAISTTNNTITISGHTFTDGTRVILFPTFDEAGNPSSAPGGISYNTVFYVRDVSGNTFKLAATLNGTVIPMPSQGVGAHEIFSGFPIYTTSDRITEASILNFEKKMDIIEADKLLVGTGQALPAPGISSQRTTAWNTKLTHAITVDFGSANAARYFFNAGGELRFNALLDFGAGDAIYTNWKSMLDNTGTISMNYTQTSATGTGTGSSIGFYDLTSSNQQLFTKTGTGSYASNDYTIFARCDVAANTQGGARYVYITIEFNDDKGPNPNFDENVTGTLISSVSHLRPQGTNVSVSPPSYLNTTELSSTVTAPTYSISGSPTSGNESSTFTFTVSTTDVSSGTILYWGTQAVSGVVDASDFSDNATTGTVTINGNSGTITRTMRADGLSEITEGFRIQIYLDSGRTILLAVSNDVTVINSSG